MILKPPLKQYIVSQPFGANANDSYAKAGLKGHSGIDMVSFWKDTIMAAVPAYLYSTYNFDNSDFMQYRAVLTLVEEGNTVYEVSYGHCEDFLGTIGTQVAAGEPLALEGNTGTVYVNGVEVTEGLKIAGSHSGTHLHFQVRLCEKHNAITDTVYGHYITNAAGNYQRTSDNKFIHIVDFENGFNGCINPLQFFESTIDAENKIAQAATTIASQVSTSPDISIPEKISLLQQILNALKTLFH